ncbi:MAG TPA: phosphoglucosamine mutase [Gemmataceae bacterium]|nr:phosphoglucosamine mutase [Gemmataceae bacterium]
MASDLIVSVSGIRGVIGAGLSPAPVLAFAAALGTHHRGGRLLVCRDSRPSGRVLRHAVLAGFLGTGCDVVDIGVAPTPTCGLAVTRLGAAGAIQITASHNPAPWNGLKLFGGDGAVLSAAKGRQVKEIYDSGQYCQVPWDKLGTLTENTRAETWHRQRIMELIDVTRIRGRDFRVLLDANGGAGGPLGESLLTEVHCRPVVQGGLADGHFAHPPEPLAENLRDIAPLVAQEKADMGFVLDPDADRLAIIDETGRYIGEELTLALAVSCRLRQERGPVVINMSTSRAVEDIARQFGVPCYRSAVGEANVVEKMRAVGAVIGGEGNGGVIDPRVGWVRDPFIGMGLVLELLAQTRQSLGAQVGELPAYTIVKDKYEIARERLPGLGAALTKRWPEARANQEDGLRLDWEDRWVHVRPSNTEPVVRVIAEARLGEDAEKLCRAVGESM